MSAPPSSLRHKWLFGAGLVGLLFFVGMTNAGAVPSVSDMSGLSGGRSHVTNGAVTIGGKNFPKSATVALVTNFGTGDRTTTVKTNTSGAWSASLQLPSTSWEGVFSVTATSGSKSVKKAFRVTPTATDSNAKTSSTKTVMAVEQQSSSTPAASTKTKMTATAKPKSTKSGTDAPVATPKSTTATATSGASTTPTNPGIAGTWKLAFHDEFSGTALDLTKWIMCNPSFENSCQPYNEEQQTFNTAKNNANVKVSGGALHLVATKENGKIMSGMVSTGPDKFGYNQAGYKSFQFTYGYYEGRVKLAKGNGFWPSMWMLPDQKKYGKWPNSGEYDVFEIPGNNPSEYHFTAHWGGSGGECGHPCTPQQANISDSSANWHVFGLDWEKDGLTWYVDGKKMGNKVTDAGAIKATPFYIIANFSVGGSWGPLKGGPDASTPFPASYDIDYLRVWQHQ